MLFDVDGLTYATRPFRTVGGTWAVSIHPVPGGPRGQAGNAANIEVLDAASAEDASAAAAASFTKSKQRG